MLTQRIIIYRFPNPWNVVPTEAVASSVGVKTILGDGKLFKFDGSRMNWFSFANAFYHTVHRVKFHVTIKVTALRRALEAAYDTDPNSEMAQTLLTITTYQDHPRAQYRYMLAQLESYYGQLDTYIQIILHQLRTNGVRSGNLEDVMQFHAKLDSYLQAQYRYLQCYPAPEICNTFTIPSTNICQIVFKSNTALG